VQVLAPPARRRAKGADTHVRREAELAGATFVDQQAVIDGRTITAQTWQSHPFFYREIFARLSPAA
jgi:protease I